MPLLPYVRRELFLQAIKNRDASALPDPNNREELFLKAIAEETALIPTGVSVVLPAAVSEMLANLPEAHTHTELFYKEILDTILTASTVTDTTPFISRETAGGLPVSGTAELKKKLGNTVGVNQLFNETFSPGTYTYDIASAYFTMTAGRTYLFFTDENELSLRVRNYDEGIIGTTAKYVIYACTITSNGYTIQGNGTSTKTAHLRRIDLSIWYGSTDRIPSDLLSHPENWGRYFAGSLDYAAGYLDSADGTVLKSIGRNVWDEEFLNGYFDTTTGAFVTVSTNTNIAPKNYIPVIPNTEYAIKQPTTNNPQIYCYRNDYSFIYRLTGIATGVGTFTVPSDCAFIKFCVFTYGAGVYNHDITISLYYPGESGYDQYYPYSVLAEVDTGSEVLRSAGSVADEKTPDGTITRRVGVYTFTGSESWTYNSGSAFWYYVTNITSAYYWKGSGQRHLSNGVAVSLVNDKQIRVYLEYNPNITSSSDLNAIFPNGTTMTYELATPTTEQGTAFDPVYDVEYGGTESWTNLKGIPQGHETEYTEYTT